MLLYKVVEFCLMISLITSPTPAENISSGISLSCSLLKKFWQPSLKPKESRVTINDHLMGNTCYIMPLCNMKDLVHVVYFFLFIFSK